MFLKRRLAPLAAVIAAAAVGVPAASANAAPPTATTGAVPMSTGCSVWHGISNPATGCYPYWAIGWNLVTAPYNGWFGR
jgi:hypothetical protein